MNFQALSVGQKLNEKSNSTRGGYLDADATPSAALLTDFAFVDDSIGAMVKEIKERGLYESTLIIITAKHGQNPIDPNFYNPILNTGTSPATLLDNAGLIPFSEAPSNPDRHRPDRGRHLACSGSRAARIQRPQLASWNRTSARLALDRSSTALARHQLRRSGTAPEGDPRTPDIIVTPNVGVVYTGSTKKQEEHGGFCA